ncbi:uncharacterized protein LOC127422481 [Myxocyprinus asiaticus]|uniref:uncharacterized protein LOC127422481 n=1 Tax=Myxocyprinus asiaticus TaxID=70543 RepID=UPI0022235134|nr:uncharacterized protein LOC127422481 [Myxocyprinus asiaticus]
MFLIRRIIIKARLDQQSGANGPLHYFPIFLSRLSTVTNLLIMGSRNNTRENLSMAGIPDPCRGRDNHSHETLHSQDLIRAHDPCPRPSSHTHTVYAAIKLPEMKQGGHSPKQKQKSGYPDNGLETSTVTYATLEFMGKNEPAKRKPEGTDDSAVYATESKNKHSKNSPSEPSDYENVSFTGAPKPLFTNIDWNSDTSEEDEMDYASVSCSAKPKYKQKCPNSSSNSDEEDKTVYSAIKI